MDNSSKIELYESIDDLPIVRYHLFQLMLLQDSGIGSTMGDVVEHLSKMDYFMTHDMKKEAQDVRRNLQVTYFNIINELNYNHLAYACLVKRIGDETFTSIQTEHDVKQIHDKLKAIVTVKEVDEEVEKKKMIFEAEMKTFFPKRYQGVKTSELTRNEVRRQYLIAEYSVMSGDINESEHKIAVRKFLDQNKPRLLDNSTNSEVIQSETAFHEMILIAQSSYSGINVFSTTKQFYSAMTLIEKQQEKQPHGRR
jgi:hypothetical protein